MAWIMVICFFICAIVIEKGWLPGWIYKLSGFQTILFSFACIALSVLIAGLGTWLNLVTAFVTIFASLLIVNKFSHLRLLGFGGNTKK